MAIKHVINASNMYSAFYVQWCIEIGNFDGGKKIFNPFKCIQFWAWLLFFSFWLGFTNSSSDPLFDN